MQMLKPGWREADHSRYPNEGAELIGTLVRSKPAVRDHAAGGSFLTSDEMSVNPLVYTRPLVLNCVLYVFA